MTSKEKEENDGDGHWEKEGEREKETSQPTRSRFSASSNGRAIPLGDPPQPVGPWVRRRLLGSQSLQSSPRHIHTLPTLESAHSTDREEEAFVVKRYRSARGFKRLLYEYTRGGGGSSINGVALSCRHVVFTRDYRCRHHHRRVKSWVKTTTRCNRCKG